jgi:hypothetical protein
VADCWTAGGGAAEPSGATAEGAGEARVADRAPAWATSVVLAAHVGGGASSCGSQGVMTGVGRAFMCAFTCFMCMGTVYAWERSFQGEGAPGSCGRLKQGAAGA